MSSEIKLSTIADASGNNSSTPAQIQQGLYKAWVNWNAQGTVTVRDSYGVNSVGDNGSGIFQLNWDPVFPSGNYAIAGACGNTNNTVAGTNCRVCLLGGGKGSSSVFTDNCTVLCGYTDNVNVDYPQNMAIAIGD